MLRVECFHSVSASYQVKCALRQVCAGLKTADAATIQCLPVCLLFALAGAVYAIIPVMPPILHRFSGCDRFGLRSHDDEG
eukprot:3832632-Amphidinium_carterae.1